jgi:hypothetical protein
MRRGCLKTARFLEDCRFVASTTPTFLERIYGKLAHEPGVRSANFNHIVCPYFPICDPVVAGHIVASTRST